MIGRDTAKTLEHVYQALKATTPQSYRYVMAAVTPSEAKARGRNVICRKEWDEVRDTPIGKVSYKLWVMYDLLRIKFSNPQLKEKLYDTYPQELIERNSWGDRYWGVCQGVGSNHLGKLLVKVRTDLMIEDNYLNALTQLPTRRWKAREDHLEMIDAMTAYLPFECSPKPKAVRIPIYDADAKKHELDQLTGLINYQV